MAKSWLIAAFGAVLIATGGALAPSALAGPFASKAEQRTEIDAREREALERLFAESEKARRLHDDAYGYATFSIVKVSLGFTGGGGQGVAVDKRTGARTYMRMGTGGLNFGAGAQLYQLVFLFEDRATFEHFVNDGWEAGASANAVAGTAGLNAGASFINGLAVYQLTEGGLMLQIDISGTKYWQSRLN